MRVRTTFHLLLSFIFVLFVLLFSPPAKGLVPTTYQESDIADVSDETPQLVVDADGFTAVKISHLAISSNGKFLAAAAGKVVRIWDLKNNRPWAVLRGATKNGRAITLDLLIRSAFPPMANFCQWEFLTIVSSDRRASTISASPTSFTS